MVKKVDKLNLEEYTYGHKGNGACLESMSIMSVKTLNQFNIVLIKTP